MEIRTIIIIDGSKEEREEIKSRVRQSWPLPELPSFSTALDGLHVDFRCTAQDQDEAADLVERIADSCAHLFHKGTFQPVYEI